ncbi:MAG: threonine/serine exporter family protein [Verrucomicrobiales bacterium]|jgi:uncharacterized membrane protein YjjB (DUF3815 family)|nr:threonine/serine exporter family protein [Verrucomicrobiales bacterium]
MDLNIVMVLQDMVLAAIPAVGFALLFNVPKHSLGYCAMGGAIGHGLRFVLTHEGMRIEWATLIAATLVSFIGVYWARRLLAHPKVFTVAAIIPMIPGKPAFTAMLALFEISRSGFSTDLQATLTTNFLQMSFIVAALALGLAMPGLIYRKPII